MDKCRVPWALWGTGRGAIKMINHGRGEKNFFSHQKDGAHESIRNKLTKFCLKICSFFSKQVCSNKK